MNRSWDEADDCEKDVDPEVDAKAFHQPCTDWWEKEGEDESYDLRCRVFAHSDRFASNEVMARAGRGRRRRTTYILRQFSQIAVTFEEQQSAAQYDELGESSRVKPRNPMVIERALQAGCDWTCAFGLVIRGGNLEIWLQARAAPYTSDGNDGDSLRGEMGEGKRIIELKTSFFSRLTSSHFTGTTTQPSYLSQ